VTVRRLFTVAALLAFLSALFGAPSATADEAAIYQYWHSANWSNRCFGPYGGNMANGTRITQWSCNSSLDQQWTAIPLLPDSGYYLMRNRKNENKCLSVKNNWQSPGVELIIWDCLGVASQLWDARYIDDLGYEIINKNSQLAIAVSGGSSANGAAIIQWTPNKRLEQSWDVP